MILVGFEKVLQSQKHIKWEKKHRIKKYIKLFFILILIITICENILAANKEEKTMIMKLEIGNSVFIADLEKNSSVEALKKLLTKPVTFNMIDYAGMEKTADLGVKLPQNNINMNTQPGDIILYQGRTLVIYYDRNSWSLTPIGKIKNLNVSELRKALGKGNTTVTISIE